MTVSTKPDVLRPGEMILDGCIRSELPVLGFRALFNIVGYMFTYFIAIC